MKNKNVFTLRFLEAGEYIGRIDSYNLATATDGLTQFLNLAITIELEGCEEEIQISKSYLTNLGKNQRLRHFLKDSNLINKRNEVNLEGLLGMEVAFSIDYDENGKLIVGDLEQYIDFTDEDDE